MRNVTAMLSLLLLSSCAHEVGPPQETATFRPETLAELTEALDGIVLDVRYATPNNFVGRPVYDEARVFLQRPAAMALLRVRDRLRAEGLGLLVFDGYRPWHVTKTFWDLTPPEKRHFVADPSKGSRHNRGAAVDVSLYRLADGRPLEMPTEYDDFTEAAHIDYEGACPEATGNRERLRRAMEAEGFQPYVHEWWHFDHETWRGFPIGNASFAELDGVAPRLTDGD